MPSYPRSAHRLSGGRDYRRIAAVRQNDATGTGSGSSGAAAAVAPANTVAPAVTGTRTVGQTLSTTTGTWTGTATITYTYQWQRDTGGNGTFANIGSATASTYVLVAADAQNKVRCVVTGTNAAGNASANSNGTGFVQVAGLTATFETGVNGATVSTGDAGSATALNDVTISANGLLKYSTAQVNSGSLSAVMGATGAGAGSGVFGWSTSFGTLTDHYGRLFLYLPQYESGQMPLVQIGQGAGASTRGARIDITAAGKIAGFDNPAAALFTTGSVSVALNQWVRIEWHVIASATVGQAIVKLFNTATSLTPDETLTGTANKNTLANHTGISLGVVAGNLATNHVFYMDDIIVGATAFPGPA